MIPSTISRFLTIRYIVGTTLFLYLLIQSAILYSTSPFITLEADHNNVIRRDYHHANILAARADSESGLNLIKRAAAATDSTADSLAATDSSSSVQSTTSRDDALKTGIYCIDRRLRRVAIIGAGAGGSSAAYFLSRAKAQLGLPANSPLLQIDVYDSGSVAGGRSGVVYPMNNKSMIPVEIGASIFVEANVYMVKAAKQFGLTLTPGSDQMPNGGVAFFDGKTIGFSLPDGSDASNGAYYARYGLETLYAVQDIVYQLLSQFALLYSPEFIKKHGAFTSVEDLSSSTNFTAMTSVTGQQYLSSNGVNQLYIDEIADSSLRVNYAQNIIDTGALPSLVSLATDGAQSVKGGNYQVFQEYLRRSKANVYLNTVVQSLTQVQVKNSEPMWQLKTANSKTLQTYDAIIFAAPIQYAGIQISPNKIASACPTPKYVHLHVTLVSTNTSRLRPEAFGLKHGDVVPQSILTTSDAADFNSITYHSTIQPDGTFTVKIFSKTTRSDAWLANMFGKENLRWIYRKEWDAYPTLKPTTCYEPIQPAGMQNFYYLNTMERFVSTMETSTLGARTGCALLLKKFFNIGVGQGRIGRNGIPVNDWDWLL